LLLHDSFLEGGESGTRAGRRREEGGEERRERGEERGKHILS